VEEVTTDVVEQFADTVREILSENNANCAKQTSFTLIGVAAIAGTYLLGRRAIRMIERRGANKQRQLDKIEED